MDFMKEYHESMLKIQNMYEMKRKAWAYPSDNNKFVGYLYSPQGSHYTQQDVKIPYF